MEQMILPGVVESLEELCDFLDRIAEKAGLDAKTLGKLHLAVDEMATNVVTHGYEEQGLTGDLIVSAEITPEALTVTLEDTSLPFDPRALEPPASLDQPLEERPIGGLGIYLMRKSVDRYDYAYVDGKNRNVFVFNRPSPAST